MDINDYIRVFKSEENENKNFELKNSQKIVKEEKLNIDDILKIIVGFSNLDGGYLIIGVNDDGSPEGIGIFNRFKDGSKSGIDKVKENIINTCRDKISPIINIDIQFFLNDEYEFLAIIVPKKRNIPHAIVKRSGNKITNREYFIKNAHSCTPVSDSQLEWLFNTNNFNSNVSYYLIQASTYKNLGGIPISVGIGKLGDWLVMQPNVLVSTTAHFIHEIYDKVKNKLAIDFDYRRELFSEIILYNIIQTLDGYGSRCIPKEAKYIPQPPIEFHLHDASRGKERELFDIFTNKIIYPNDTIIEFSKNDRHTVSCTFKNKHANIKINLQTSSFGQGLSGQNPYRSVMYEIHGIKFQDSMDDNYETYIFNISVEVERNFPDVFDNIYYDTLNLLKKINDTINNYWDINNYLKEYPHYKKMYSIEYKIDQLLNSKHKSSKFHYFLSKLTSRLLRFFK